MAVSKRTRYEVLRRDNHTCRYCGGVAPDIALTVDHVTPVSLGGSDDPSNLVAACRDCNAGKSSSSPDAPLVAEVSEDALRWSEAMRTALEGAASGAVEREKYRKKFRRAWVGWKLSGKAVALPDDWSRTIDRWGALPVPAVILEDAVRIAMSTTTVHAAAKWKYFCGIVWRTLDDARDKVEGSLVNADPAKCGHCIGCRETEYCWVYDLEANEDPVVCDRCGEAGCLYPVGQEDGSQAGWISASEYYEPFRNLFREFGHHMIPGDVLERFIDGRLDGRHELITGSR